MTTAVVGRFAPTPSGNLHFGSVVTALASYLNAKAQNGEWLLRIDNLDPPREKTGAADSILLTLGSLGLEWDRLIYQSQRSDDYAAAVANLAAETYYCQCSRKSLHTNSQSGPDGSLIYPGNCRSAAHDSGAIRIKTTISAPCECDDLIRGRLTTAVLPELGDFIVRRVDGLFAYHLATVVDDKLDGVTEIIRGDDLFYSSIRHIFLQQQLGYPIPAYGHIPVVKEPDGIKFSKSRLSPAIDHAAATQTLGAALTYLQHPPPPDIKRANPPEILAWAVANWNVKRLSQIHSQVVQFDAFGNPLIAQE